MRKFFLEESETKKRCFFAPKRKKRRAVLSKYRAQMTVLDFFAITVTVVQIEHVVFEKRAVPSFRAAFFHSRNADYTNRTVLVAAANCTFVNLYIGKKGLKFLPYSRFAPTASTSIVHFFGIFIFRRERKSASFGIDLRRVDGRRRKLHVVQISSYNFSRFLDPRRSGVIHPLDHLKHFFIHLHFSEYFGRLLLKAHAFHWDHVTLSVSTLFLNYTR